MSPQFTQASAALSDSHSLIRRKASPAAGLVFSSGKGKSFSQQLLKFRPWLLCDSSTIRAILKRKQPEAGSPLLCSSLAGEFIKVAGRVVEHRTWVSPGLPCFLFVQCNSVRKVLLTSTVPPTDGAVTKCLSLQGTFPFLFSVTKLESQFK